MILLSQRISVKWAMRVRTDDWRPMERHPRPLRRRNPEEMGPSMQGRADPSLE
jgi:hypothetical protein